MIFQIVKKLEKSGDKLCRYQNEDVQNLDRQKEE